MEDINLPNHGRPIDFAPGLYYPRLQVNGRGEIVLATYKDPKYGLTQGILVGYTPDAIQPRRWKIGQKFSDWEVAGELVDYDGEVTVRFKNAVKTEG